MPWIVAWLDARHQSIDPITIRPQVRIVASNPLKTYISHALSLLNDKGHSTVVLRSMGRAINKTVAIGELRVVPLTRSEP